MQKRRNSCKTLEPVSTIYKYFCNIVQTINAKYTYDKYYLELEDPIHWPGLAICRSPIFKDKTAFENLNAKFNSDTNQFTSEKDFNDSIKEVYLTDPEEIVVAVSIGKTMMDAVAKDRPAKIPIKEPYVNTILSDYTYNGYCATISVSKLVDYLVEIGELKTADNDTPLWIVIWLKVALFSVSNCLRFIRNVFLLLGGTFRKRILQLEHVSRWRIHFLYWI